jgi:anaerobic selenocysteine-containing dehydrogenase
MIEVYRCFMKGGKIKPMQITRRDFMKISGAAVGGLALGGLGFNLAPVEAQAQMLKIRWAKETTTICPYCAVGCGLIVHTSRDGSGKTLTRAHSVPKAQLCTSWSPQRVESSGLSIVPLTVTNGWRCPGDRP